ncbi:unnamed protein product, partial [Polarella glacialis]
ASRSRSPRRVAAQAPAPALSAAEKLRAAMAAAAALRAKKVEVTAPAAGDTPPVESQPAAVEVQEPPLVVASCHGCGQGQRRE